MALINDQIKYKKVLPRVIAIGIRESKGLLQNSNLSISKE